MTTLSEADVEQSALDWLNPTRLERHAAVVQERPARTGAQRCLARYTPAKDNGGGDPGGGC